jgi:hypothetical protein
VSILQESTTAMAQAPNICSFDEFQAWGNREREALREMYDEADIILGSHGALRKEDRGRVVAVEDGYTHTTMFDVQSQGAVAGYIPNNGTNAIYLSSIG